MVLLSNRNKPPMPIIRSIYPYAAASAVMVLLALTEATKSLGAHPWWAVMVIWRGLPIGLALAFAASFSGVSKPVRAVIFGAVMIVAAFVSSHYHTRFVAAENADAFWPGRIWFYGWITMMATLPALITTLLQRK